MIDNSSVLRHVTVAVILFLGTLYAETHALAAEIKLLASPGVRAAVTELLPEFESKTGHKVIPQFAVIAVLKRRIDAGEIFDVANLSPEVIGDLIKQGAVKPDTRVPFARTGLGVAAAKSARKPDISTVENFRRALLNAKSVAYSKEGLSGTNFLEVLKQLGISEQMQAKLKPAVGNPIQEGEADMAISGVGPAMEMAEADYLGPVPADVQRYVIFTAAVSAATKQPEAAAALLRFLASPAAAWHSRAKAWNKV